MKSSPDFGTAGVDWNANPSPGASATVPPRSLFPEDDRDRRRWRVRPAELARMLGTSKQSISRAIAAGKILLGPDGKVNPEQATAQYLRHSDPARLRARLLAPFVRDLQVAQARELELRAECDRLRGELADAADEAGFQEACANEFQAQARAAVEAVRGRWDDLSDLDARCRDALLGALLSLATERWHVLEALAPEDQARALGDELLRRVDSLADADEFPDAGDAEDFVASLTPPTKAPTPPSPPDERETVLVSESSTPPKAPNPPSHDEDDDHDR